MGSSNMEKLKALADRTAFQADRHELLTYITANLRDKQVERSLRRDRRDPQRHRSNPTQQMGSHKMRDQLIAIKELIKDPAHWCQDALAVNHIGVPVSPTSPRAYCWCFRGAMYKVLGVTEPPNNCPLEDVLYNTSNDLYPGQGMIGVNDDIGHEAVMKVLDDALLRHPA
jgi:hypothetical protein